MPLLIHGEVTTAGVDIFDKEARFIEEVIKVNALAACMLLLLRSLNEGLHEHIVPCPGIAERLDSARLHSFRFPREWSAILMFETIS